jgi:Spy/CpxP family protein refolding chaperone
LSKLKKILLITAIVALLIGSLTLAAFAYGPGNGGGWGCKGGGNFGINSLNLTAEQQQKILAIRQEFQKNTLALRQEMRKKRQELQPLWSADTINQGAIDAKTREMNSLRIQMVQKSREMSGKIKAVLTPEQLKQLESRKQERGQGHRGPGMWGGGNGSPGNGNGI